MIIRRVFNLDDCLNNLRGNIFKAIFIKISFSELFKKHFWLIRLLKLNNCQTVAYSFFKTAKRFNIEIKLLIGINDYDRFSSHAWIENNGKSYYLSQESRYEVIHKI